MSVSAQTQTCYLIREERTYGRAFSNLYKHDNPDTLEYIDIFVYPAIVLGPGIPSEFLNSFVQVLRLVHGFFPSSVSTPSMVLLILKVVLVYPKEKEIPKKLQRRNRTINSKIQLWEDLRC